MYITYKLECICDIHFSVYNYSVYNVHNSFISIYKLSECVCPT